jgi:putative addiction module component (TIGR02574 family)
MKASTLSELLKLSPAERIQLAQDLWDSIDEREATPLTEEQIREVEQRLAEHDADPESAIPWQEVRERLRSRYGV